VITSQFSASDTVVAASLLPSKGRASPSRSSSPTPSIPAPRASIFVAAYARGLGRGTLTVTGSANFTKTGSATGECPAVHGRHVPDQSRDDSEPILNPEDRNRLEDAMPRSKGSLAARYGLGSVRGLARATTTATSSTIIRPTRL